MKLAVGQRVNRTRGLRWAICILVFAIATAITAHASTTTYDLALAPYNQYTGPNGGTGSFTVSPSPSPTNPSEFFTVGGTNALNLNIMIDSVDFVTGDFGSSCTAEYTDGTLDSIYGCSGTAEGDALNLGSTSYTFYVNGVYNTGGSVTITPSSSVTPEPPTLLLWGSGLVLLGSIFRRKFS